MVNFKFYPFRYGTIGAYGPVAERIKVHCFFTKMNEKLFKESAVRVPSLQHLSEISRGLGLDIEESELGEYSDAIAKTLGDTYQRLYELPDPKLPVKYPRTPGFRPTAEENPFNAWYWCCDIKGAPSGKLQGKTVAIKDNTCVSGVPMMNGSHILRGFVPDVDATVVSRILDAGGHILGKAVCEDLCFSGGSFTSVTGPVLNPHSKTRMAGGSSSGSAELRWRKWKRAFQLYVLGKGITNDSQKRGLLLHTAGLDVQEVYFTLVPDGAETNYAETFKVLDDYFIPKANVPATNGVESHCNARAWRFSASLNKIYPYGAQEWNVNWINKTNISES
ncbi:amidase-like [Montipora foliosa]|uniref:amidase-like n=1 Tax=Montipora foliosa TaxID=591990 RepID=UPI0035F1BD83